MPAEITPAEALAIEPVVSAPSTHQRGLSLNFGATSFGFLNYRFRLDLQDGAVVFDDFSLELGDVGARKRLTTIADGFELRLDVERLGKRGQYLVTPTLVNNGASARVFTGFAFGQFGEGAQFLPGPGHVLGWALKYAHSGNLRTERYPFCAADYPYLRHLPVENRTVGDTEDQPFPALFVQNEQNAAGVVFGLSTQKAAAPVFTLLRNPLFRPDVFDVFELRWDYPQSRGYRIKPGEIRVLDTLYLQLTDGVAADRAFEDYLDHVAERNDFRGRDTALNQVALHCTWNYGVFQNQRRDTLIDTARFIAKNLPEIRYFLIDDGYLTHQPDFFRVHLDRFYPTPESAPISEESWPDGMRGFTDELREMGLRPGLWWTPMVRLPCRMHDEHPDWFLRKKDGSLYLIGGKLAYLDYSHPEALAYLDRTLAHILGKWGVDACKIDFYSQNFETRDALLHRPDCSSLEIRRAFFETVRRHLPADGVIMSCIAMGMGNPFLGEFVETFRCSMDIGEGTWREQINNSRWSLPTLSFGGRRSCLPNLDSVGFNTKLSEAENMFRLTWCYITMGLIETGGRLEELAPRHLAALKKLLERCDRGHPSRCPDIRTFSGSPLPEILYVDFPADSATAARGIRQSVAFFNWEDTSRAVSVMRSALGHEGAASVEDFWTGAREAWRDDHVTVVLPPRSARLFDIMPS